MGCPPVRNHRRHVDNERRGMRFPVRLKHLPTSRNHALPSIFNLAGPPGINADQMRAANKTRRKTTSRETVESRVASPDKDTSFGLVLSTIPGQSGEKYQRVVRHPNAMIR